MKRAAVIVALGVLTASAACTAPSQRDSPPTAKTTRGSTTALSTTTTAPMFALAPQGCDASKLARAKPRDDQTAYDVDATYDPTNNVVRGTLVARFTPDKATDRVYMRLWPNGPASVAKGGGIDLADASVDGDDLPLSLESATTAYVTKPLAAHRQVRVRVGFTVTLPVGSDDRLSRVGDAVRLGSWLPLLPWEPGVGWALDPPTSAFAEASTSVHADFAVRLEVPDGLQVIASGSPSGATQWRIEDAPDWAAAIGRFDVEQGNANGVPVTVAVEQSMSETAQPYMAEVVASINDLARRYGAYPWPSYNLALTPGMRGGIEYPGLVLQGANTNARTTPHEVAHQWFYALVGSNQGRDPWLDEGLATWAEAVTDDTFASFRGRSIPADGRNRLGEPMTYWERHQPSYYRSVYVQGMQALAALGVSEAAVDCALARYVATHAYRVATPRNLADALATVAPEAPSVLARYGAQRVS